MMREEERRRPQGRMEDTCVTCEAAKSTVPGRMSYGSRPRCDTPGLAGNDVPPRRAVMNQYRPNIEGARAPGGCAAPIPGQCSPKLRVRGDAMLL